MCFFFKLSRYIVVPVLLDWLGACSLVQLDSALCNRSLRERFLQLIIDYNAKFRQTLFTEEISVHLSMKLMNWCSQRNLGYFKHVTLPNSLLKQLQSVLQTNLSQSLPRCSLSRFLQSSKTKSDISLKQTLLLLYFSKVNQIELPQFSESNVNVLVDVLRLCTKLENVTVSGADSSPALKALKTSGVALKELSMYQCKVKEKTLMLVCRQSPDLQLLSLKQSLQLRCASLQQITVNNRRVSSLCLDQCGGGGSSRGLQQLSLHCLTPLTSLTLHQATDLTVRCLVWSRGLSSLKCLDLSYSPSVSDFTLSEVGAACGHSLQEIRLKNCHAITTSGVHALCQQAAGLTLLDLRNLSKLTNGGVASAVLHCRGLRTLLLYSQEQINSVGLRYIGSYASQLTCLSLCNMELTDESLVGLVVSCCSSLRHLELAVNGRLTDQAFVKLALVCGAQLELLDLTCCDRLTEATLLALAEHCPALVDLNVSICNLVSDKGVSEVVRRCRALTSLSLFYCKSVSDAGLMDMAEYGSTLSQLNIGHTAVSSAATIERIIRQCRRLKELKLTHPDQDKLTNFADRVNPNLKLEFLQ